MFITPEDAAHIARELKATIGRDVNIMDRTGIIIASTDPRRVGQPHRIAQQIIQENLPIREVLEDDPMAGVQRGVNLPIHVDGICEGVIGITGPAEEVRDFGTVAKKMAEILLTTMRQQEQQAHLERARNLFIEEWLFAPKPDWETLSIRGELLDMKIELPRRLALLECRENPSALMAETAPGLLSGRLPRWMEPEWQKDVIWTVTGRQVLFLFSGNAMEQATVILRNIGRAAKEQCGFQISGGISSVSRDPEDLRRCYTEAVIAARAAGKDGSIREYSTASLDLILQNMDESVRRDVLRAVFPPLPPEEEAELLESLQLYFQYDGNMERASAQACVHPNTFRYRLRKLTRHTGLDLRRPRDEVLLYIALQFYVAANE